MVDLPSFNLTTTPLTGLTGLDVVALPVRGGGSAGNGAGNGAAEGSGPRVGDADAEVARGLGIDPEAVLELQKAKGAPGETVVIPAVRRDAAVKSVILLGIGDGSPQALRKAGAALARQSRDRARVATTTLADLEADAARAFVEGYLLAGYRFSRKSEPPESVDQTVDLVVADPGSYQEAVDRGVVTGRAVRLARDLANTPANEKSPAWLAEQAELVAERAGLAVRVWDERELAAKGFGGLVAVGMGSARPPRLIELAYQPDRATRKRKTPHVVLVGKGITFDTGGLSLKPREAMVPMKTDMSGGGAVIAVMSALRDLGVGVRVTGLVAAAENMPSGSAQRPGDVITQYGGKTVEIMNTDAEGRLVLADALAYADRELTPDVIVDLATLTGAATLGLGRQYAALYATDEALAEALLTAGQASGDRLWRMPLVEDYRSTLDSDVADICHVNRDPRIGGGSITAALFLREFVGERPWAHLDIAGPARADADADEITRGGTGFGTRALLRWLEGLG